MKISIFLRVYLFVYLSSAYISCKKYVDLELPGDLVDPEVNDLEVEHRSSKLSDELSPEDKSDFEDTVDFTETVDLDDSFDLAESPEETPDDSVVVDDEVKVEEEEEPDRELTEEELLDNSDDSSVLTSDKLFRDSTKSEKFEYQAEVTRLLDIIVNSIYSSKDIFLRELVSNSADALEKYKITALQKNYSDKDTVDLFIRVRSYPKKRLLTIWDSGVGMTKNDLMNNLGTIAKSGTANFLDSLSKVGNDPNLIGQFGVGFYSAFLVADTVIVQSKHRDDKQYVWKSSAANSYELFEDSENTLGDHGTLITLELREDATEYLKTDVLENLVKKYSQFVKYPIQLYKKLGEKQELGWVSVNETQQIWTRSKNTITEKEYNDFFKKISGKDEEPLAHVHFTAEGDVDFKALLYIPSSPSAMYFTTDTVNHNVKLYSRRVLVSENLRDFIPRYLFSVYGVVDSDSFPLNVSREYLQQSKLVKVIGKKVVRTVLDTLFDVMKKSEDDVKEVSEELEKVKAVNGESEWNSYKKEWKKRDESGYKSFVEELKKEAEKKKEEKKEEKKEKKEDNKEDKKEKWMEDMKLRKKKLERKLKEVDKYGKFYKGFKGSLKVGCYDDDQNRKKIARLLRYKTLFSEKELTFDQYVEAMKEEQTEIYYVTSENYEDLKTMPHLQGLKKRKFDVLYLSDTMDESCLTKLEEYKGKKFKNVQKADLNLKLTEEEENEEKRKEAKYKPLLLYLKDMFPETSGVKLSRRLVEDPCTVVASEWSMSSHMEKLMKSYAVHRDEKFETFNKLSSKVLELNPDHPIMIKLLYLFTQAQNMLKEDKLDKEDKEDKDKAAKLDKEDKHEDADKKKDESEEGAEKKESKDEDEEATAAVEQDPELVEKKKRYMKRLDRLFKLLYNAAKLKSGFVLEEPQLVVNYLYEKLNRSLGDVVERDYDKSKDLKLDDFEVPKVDVKVPEHVKRLQEQEEARKAAEASKGVALNLDAVDQKAEPVAEEEDEEEEVKKPKKKKEKTKTKEEEKKEFDEQFEAMNELFMGKDPEGYDVTRGEVDDLDESKMMLDTLKSRGLDVEKLRNKEEDYDWANDEL
ncbi:molecular chaperone protein [Theileria orientalis strain Shintoku]|uniref:Molecular chaperone protein n=1 Tax=Theileria orientalis strain Shintoku TaxID=869250 RepID=J4D691_THEOR|nr:molecular chaperone protein [Theileria orientalis strain Shintoku]BAM39425.1 molecular chaperone protein [Theileria orientalis strain Shintoku]|eukprot:XP_009689726.1 molecular chaperone protein [Theileria orientalis strain Shintoku]